MGLDITKSLSDLTVLLSPMSNRIFSLDATFSPEDFLIASVLTKNFFDLDVSMFLNKSEDLISILLVSLAERRLSIVYFILLLNMNSFGTAIR